MHKIRFRWGSAPDQAGGGYNTSPDPLTVFKVPTSKGRAGEERRKGKGREEEGASEGRGKE